MMDCAMGRSWVVMLGLGGGGRWTDWRGQVHIREGMDLLP